MLSTGSAGGSNSPATCWAVSVSRVLARRTSFSRVSHQGPLFRQGPTGLYWQREVLPARPRGFSLSVSANKGREDGEAEEFLSYEEYERVRLNESAWRIIRKVRPVRVLPLLPSLSPFLLFPPFICPSSRDREYSPRAFRNYPGNGHGRPFLETGPVLDMHRRFRTRQR